MSLYQNTVYDVKYGCSFGAGTNYSSYLHSYRDFDLLPVEKPTFAPPKPKTMSVEIPGSNGELDYTEALTGYVVYENRRGTFKYVYVGDRAHWDEVFHKLQKYIHGKKLRVIVDDDGYRYYDGRLTVDEPEYKNGRLYLTIEGDFYPYQMEKYSSVEPWIWDTFPFANGVIRNYESITINSPYVEQKPIEEYQRVILVGSDMPVVPDVILTSVTSSIMSMAYLVGGEWKMVTLTSGSNISKTPDLIVRDEVSLYFVGVGEVSIDYRGGCL